MKNLVPPKNIEIFFDQERWFQARKLIFNELKKNPKDHWYLTRLSTTYYEERRYKKALEISKKAHLYASECPLVLWDMASALDMLKCYSEALKIWKKLIKKGVKSIAYKECGEGIKQARSLVNDCHYRIANTLFKMRRIKESIKYFNIYIRHRDHLTPSIYDLRKVKKELSKIIEAVKSSV